MFSAVYAVVQYLSMYCVKTTELVINQLAFSL